LAFETIRLSTFDTWAVPFVGKEELAKAGLFYLRSKDLVQCFFCKGVIGYWEEGDEPFKEHRKHFPRCPFVRGDYTSNVPKEAGGSDAASSVLNKFLEKSLKNGKVPPKPNRIETGKINGILLGSICRLTIVNLEIIFKLD
ncbi:UNVERIFIED_CONTAM: hypothetical protein GTU68_000596, partial [Idotea baltica]|nr:hypothetical protein [Idotea baltica]